MDLLRRSARMSYVRVGVSRTAWGSGKEEVAIVTLGDRASSCATRLAARTAVCSRDHIRSLALQCRTAPARRAVTGLSNGRATAL